MTLPTISVGIAFGYTYADASPTYTDVTAYVLADRGINVRTGRSSELDSFEPGTATFTLNNAGRRFDPEYASGPYYGNILPRVPVRITATYSATTYNVFHGFVDGGWPQDFDRSNRIATVQLHCKDSFMVMNGLEIPVSAWAQRVSDSFYGTPEFWYTWDSEVTNQRDLTQTSYQPTASSANYGAPVITGGAWGKSLACTGGDGMQYGTECRTWSWGIAGAARQATTLEFWLQKSTIPTEEEIFYYSPAVSPDVGYVALGVNVYGRLCARFTSSAVSTETYIEVEASIADDLPHHVAMVLPAAGGGEDVQFYVDGVLPNQPTGPPDTRHFGNGSPVSIGMPPPNTLGFAGYVGRIDDVVCSLRAISQSELLDRYTAGTAGREGESTGARMSWLITECWPRGVGVQTFGAPCGPYKPSSNSLLAYCKTLESTEDGDFYQLYTGGMMFADRTRRWTDSRSTSVQATFSDDGADSKYLAANFCYDYTEVDIINDATVSSPYIQQDARSHLSTSVADYGTRRYSEATIHTSAPMAQSQAEWKTISRGVPKTRIKSISVNPTRSPTTLYPIVLGSRIADRFQVERTPQAVGSQIVTLCHVEGISHQFNASSWTTTFELSQLSVQDNFATWVTTSGASSGGNGWGGTKTWGY